MARLFIIVFALIPIAAPAAGIAVRGTTAVLRSGALVRTLSFAGGDISTSSLAVGGREMLAETSREFSVLVSREKDNRAPRGLKPEEAGRRTTSEEALRRAGVRKGSTHRVRRPAPGCAQVGGPSRHGGRTWNLFGAAPAAKVVKPSAGATRLVVELPADKDPELAGLVFELNYEVYDGYPVVRKWIQVRNQSHRWLKIERLTIDDLRLAPLTAKRLPPPCSAFSPA
jgi:hypothetical protein